MKMLALVLQEDRAGADLVGTDRNNDLLTPAITDIVVHVKVIGRLRRSLEIGEL